MKKMSNTLKLFKLLIDEKLDFFKGKTNRKKSIISIIKYLLIVALTTLACLLLVSKVTSIGIQLNSSMLSIILVFTQIIAFMMSLGTVVSSLYTSKDSELLMCMPATHNQIFVAKLMMIYVKDFVANLLYFLPIFLTYGVLGSSNLIYYLLLPIFLLVLPIIPMMVAAFISIPLMLIIKLLKKNLFVLVTVIVLLCGAAIFVYMDVVTDMVDVINFTGKQVQTVTKVNNFVKDFAQSNFLYMNIANAMLGIKSYITIPILLIFSFSLLLLSMVLVKPFYFKIAMAQIETGVTKSKKPKRFKEDSIMKSLVKKEFLVTFRTPGYIFQYFIFVLLMPFIVLVYDRLLITITVSAAGKVMISGAHLLVLSILTMLSCSVSASGISREGGNYYIMKTSPVTFKKQTVAKIVFNVIIVFIAILFTTVTSLLFVNINPVYLIACSIASFLASIGQICWNFDMDLRSPSLDWYDSGEITTLSKNTAYSIFIGLIISFVLAFLVFLFVNLSFIWGLLIILSACFALYRIHLLNLRINYYFKKNEI